MHRDRFPRTMNEAFGPYTSDQLTPMDDERAKRDARELAIVGIVCLCLLAAGLIVALGA